MPAQSSPASGVLSVVAGALGLSAVAGVLVTVMVAPAIAVAGVTANSTVGIFNSLPEYIELNPGSQQNTILVHDPSITEPDDPNYYQQVATVYKQNREEVTLDEISDYLECAAIAGEDRRFYEHGGVDTPSLVRAAIGQVTGDSGAGGASTLTMQTVRNILQQQALNDTSMTPQEQQDAIAAALAPTLDRKLAEMKLAIGLEQNYTKDEILQGYLNIAGFGGNTYGVQAAAKQYFSKAAADVTIAEAASLIAIVQYPNLRDLSSPEHYAANQERRDVILTAMEDSGCITLDERDEALAIPVDENFVHPSASTVGCRNAVATYGFVCDYALRVVAELEALGADEAERQANWDRGGYSLVLTIDPRAQGNSYGIVNQYAPANETRFDLGAVATSVQVGTGRIIAMAQNKNFDDSPTPDDPLTEDAVNYAVDRDHGGSIGFQPGSTYKPYVLLAFLAAGHGLNEYYNASVREVNQAEFADSCPPESVGGTVVGPPWGGKYTFRNDSGESGPYNIVRGTAGSVNSVFIQMAKAVDQCEIRALAESIGIHNGNPDQELITRPSCAIGGCENAIAPLQQAAAYAAIANQGVFCEPIMIDAVIDPTGETLGGQTSRCGQSLVSPSVANTAAYAMEAVMGGTGSASNPRDGIPLIGKTGTTNGSVHTWMVGSSTSVATAVWVGNVQGEQAMRNIRINGLSGGLIRHAIWKPVQAQINQLYGGHGFPGPDPALMTGTPVIVPDVVGQSLQAAEEALHLNELEFEHAGEIDSDLPAGVVAQIDPGAGSAVPRGTTVRVFTSNGLAVPVPDVVGMDRNAARATLQDADFGVTQVCADAEDLGNPEELPVADEVVSQDPAGGSYRNPASTTVTITYFRPICGP